jgi:hypothetical protein
VAEVLSRNHFKSEIYKQYLLITEVKNKELFLLVKDLEPENGI